ncbi:hypothetical protein ON010_g11455 [Phytophthora cinnamomi]|nr:hypothetical protein ON010_g11455 [Phytophthora cinnamomi]
MEIMELPETSSASLPPKQIRVLLTLPTPRIRVSAMSELKGFSGKDGDEDRARSWISKVKSAFVRDQAPDEEKCLVIGDLLTGPARNWYHQLSRTTRSSCKDLHQSFQIQYCGRGVSVARQYCHARQRSGESPLKYLHRLNVDGLRARLQVTDGSPDVRREHVEHFIETLDDRDLADQFALLRIPDADTLEEVLRSRQRAKAKQSKTVYGSTKPRQKTTAAAAGTRAVRAIHAPSDSSDSDEESCESADESLHRVYLTATTQQERSQDQRPRDQAQDLLKQDRRPKRDIRSTDEGTPPQRSRGDAAGVGGEDVKLGRSPGWNPSEATVNKAIDNTCELHGKFTAAVASLHEIDEYSRSNVKMALDITHGESRVYRKYHVPDKKFKQAKAMGKINNEKATLLFDSGAEVSILDAAFARKLGHYVDNSQALECEGVGKSPYMAEGCTRLKITLAGSLVYFFDGWVGPPTDGQDLILGMDFMVPTGIHLNLVDGSICLPDEVRIQLAGRRPLYGDKVEQVTLGRHCEIDVGGSTELKLHTAPSDRHKLWVTRGDRWVPTVAGGPGKICYLQIVNVGDRKLVLQRDTSIAMRLTGDRIPHIPGYFSIGSRRYAEWQNLTYQATTDAGAATPGLEVVHRPAVDCPLYKLPTAILKRPPSRSGKVAIVDPDDIINDSATSESHGTDTRRGGSATPANGECARALISQVCGATNPVCDTACLAENSADSSEGRKHAPIDDYDLNTRSASIEYGDEQVCIKEGGDLYAEDVEGHLGGTSGSHTHDR